MATVDWGVETDPFHFRGVLDDRFAPTEADDPLELPAVRAARGHGFEPAPEAPLWTFLPAVWPQAARGWTPDTRVRQMMVFCNAEPARAVRWSAADYFEMEADANAFLAECGLPPRPAGRVWLLKPPPGFASVDDALRRLQRSAKEAGLHVMADRAFVRQVSRDLDGLFTAVS